MTRVTLLCVMGILAFAEIEAAAGCTMKAERGPQGSNPRDVVSNLQGSAERVYRSVDCARREIKNRIKEQQLRRFSDRTSCHR